MSIATLDKYSLQLNTLNPPTITIIPILYYIIFFVLIGPISIFFEFLNIYISPIIFILLMIFILIMSIERFTWKASKSTLVAVSIYFMLLFIALLLAYIYKNNIFYVITDTFNYLLIFIGFILGYMTRYVRNLSLKQFLIFICWMFAIRAIIRLVTVAYGGGEDVGLEHVLINGAIHLRIKNPYIEVMGALIAMSAIYFSVSKKFIFYLAFFTCGTVVIISQSRGSIFALLVGLVFLHYLYGKSLIKLAALVMLCLSFMYFISPSFLNLSFDRFSYSYTQLFAPQNAEQATRYIEIAYVIKKIEHDKSWLFGEGFGAVSVGDIGRENNVLLSKKHYLYNLFLQILLRQGIIGLILFLTGIIWAMKVSNRMIRKDFSYGHVLNSGAQAIIVGFISVALVDPFLLIYPVTPILSALLGMSMNRRNCFGK